MTLFAESIANCAETAVVTVPPTYSQDGTVTAASERRNSVTIERVVSRSFGRSSLVRRIASALSISVSLVFGLARRSRRGDVVCVVSNPPVLPFAVACLARLRRLRLVVVVHDLWPDALIAAELVKERSPIALGIAAAMRSLLRQAHLVIAIGGAQQRRILEMIGDNDAPVAVVPQAADLDLIAPGPRSEAKLLYPGVGSTDLVIQIAGNLGPLQDADRLVEALCEMDIPSNIFVSIVGDGSCRPGIEERLRDGLNPSIQLVDPVPRSEVGDVHKACDVALVMLRPGMVGVSVPSRIGNVLASGKPVIAMTGAESELVELVEQHQLGWVVEPRDWQGLEKTFCTIAGVELDELRRMGTNARELAESEYSADLMGERYRDAISSVLR